MEVKINKDIREFSESIFFGLSLRQFIFSVIACIFAVVLYFALKPYLGLETLSWVCILGAAPFAVLGFVKYNGMTAEKLLFAFCRLCQFVIFVSTPSRRFSTSCTASSVGTGITSMLNIRFRFMSVSSAIISSLM